MGSLPDYPKAPFSKRFAALVIDLFIATAGPVTGLLILYLFVWPFIHLVSAFGDKRALKEVISLIIFGLVYVEFLHILLQQQKTFLEYLKTAKASGLFMLAAILILPLAYFFTKDGINEGQSFGKKYMKLMVVDITTNLPCTKVRSFLRGFILLLLCLPFGAGILVELMLGLLQKKGKRLGDFIAKTQVIDIINYRSKY